MPETSRTLAPDRPRLGLGDPLLRAVLLLTLVLQALTWHGLEGYQLADSVEYMERAHAFVRAEEVIDARTVRSFGFSALLLPFFGIAELFGVLDFTIVVWLVRLFQMGIGLALVVVCARIGERLGGRGVGLLGAFCVGVNPIFLQFGVSPLADIAGSLGVALSLDAVLARRTGFRAGLRTGGFMGLALLMAYKTAPVSGLLILLVVLRDRRRGLSALSGMLVALAGCVLLQVLLDRVVYGVWGASLVGYFGENVINIVGRLLAVSGFGDLAKRLISSYYDVSSTRAAHEALIIRQIQPLDWYLVHLPEMLVWPVMAGLVLGLVRGVKQATWSSTFLIVVSAGFVFLLHQKGSKEFRLWLPLLATLGPLAGWGLAWLGGRAGARAAWRPLLVGAGLVATIALGQGVQLERNTRKHSGYWRALDFVEAQVAEERGLDPARGRARIASAYHWAVFLRTSADLELTKLAHQIDAWKSFTEPQKNAVYPVLKHQEWFLVHQPILNDPGHADLAYAINTWFQVEAVFWDREVFEDLGPVFAMRRKANEGPDPARRTLFDLVRDVPPEQARGVSRSLGMPEPVRLIKPLHGEEMWLLGYTYEQLPGDGHGWLSTWWYNLEPCLADYVFVERLTTFDELHSWQTNEPPTWGVWPTSMWGAHSLVRESRVVVAAERPYDWRSPLRPMGGAYRRGDYMPAYLWVDVATFHWRCDHCEEELRAGHECGGVARDPEVDGTAEVSGRLERARWGDERPLREGPLAGAQRSPEGWIWSGDDLVQVGRFFLPVHPSARVPDDGRPIPD